MRCPVNHFGTYFLFWSRDLWKIDDCLDLGGRWNHEKKICEYEILDPEKITGKRIAVFIFEDLENVENSQRL
jgi:hypothetical protein